jgi:hypothetical protein
MMKGSRMKATGESLAAEIAVEQHGQPQSERQLEDGGHPRIEEGVVDGGQKDSVVENLVEVGEADELAGHAPRACWSPTAGCRARTDRL